MKIEILYEEICNLFGDYANMKYLQECLPNTTFYHTEINDIPKFVNEKIDMIYIGPMSERSQEIVIDHLLPYRDRIIELIEQNVIFLATGNALEIFGKYIENEDGSQIKGLTIFDIYAKRDMKHRHNSLLLGKLNDINIVGFKSQFSQAYGNNDKAYFINVINGIGINEQSKKEGIRINNFIGTYILGPILILNPLFTKYLLELLGVKNPKLLYEEESMKAYNKRLKEFENDKIFS